MQLRSFQYFALLLVTSWLAISPAAIARPCVSEQLRRSLENLPDHLRDYEAIRAGAMVATKSLEDFQPRQGIRVTQRNEAGQAIEGKIRVLSDNPNNKIYLLGDFNKWGANKAEADRLVPIPGTPYFEGTFRKLKHGMSYRFELNGQPVLDPAADTIATTGFMKKVMGEEIPYLNSVWWDFDRPGAYKLKYPGVDLSNRARVGGETDIFGLVQNWKYKDQIGPKNEADTYRFIAKSGVINWIKEQNYNVIRFGPFNPSVDGEGWRFRYLILDQFGIDSRFGTPDEFLKMMDAFHKEGIAVQGDFVAAHTPHRGNESVRKIDEVSVLQWKKQDGTPLYGIHKSQWDTTYYDFQNPYIREHLVDASLLSMKRYRMDSFRIDHLDGILGAEGGHDFVKHLVSDIRQYRPDVAIEGEIFEHHANLEKTLNLGGLGVDTRSHGEFTVFLRNNLLAVTEDVNLGGLHDALQKPWMDQEPFRTISLTNHDEAANPLWGASGSYPHNMLWGAGDYVAEKKVQAYSALSMFSSSSYVDMPHIRLMQKGNFTHNSSVEWQLTEREEVRKNSEFFKELSGYYTHEAAFSPQNLNQGVENHLDHTNKIVSLHRYDAQTRKHIYALINLGHHSVDNYSFGVGRGREGVMKFRLVLDNDAKKFGGSGRLTERIGHGTIQGEQWGKHDKPSAISVPHVAPYSVTIFESVP